MVTRDSKRLNEHFSSGRAQQLLDGLSFERGAIPRHVAVIMDGNGRWAKQRGKARLSGHKAGVAAVREAIGASVELGIDYLTIYSFSSENWSRPLEEVSGIMSLFVEVLAREVRELNEQNVRVRVIGDMSTVPEKTVQAFEDCKASTAQNTGLTLVVALNYGARADILNAAQTCAAEVASGRLSAGALTPEVFARHLSTQGIPDPDLLIRSSGEERLSNFLLWELAYTELYFTQTLWPDFTRESFLEAVCEYQRRNRRYGGL